MSINIIGKKFNNRKKKKRKEMLLEDYAKEKKLDLDLSFSYDDSPEKEIKSYQNFNSPDSNKFNNNYKQNLNLNKLNSASTNNSSTDDDIKEKEKKDFL